MFLYYRFNPSFPIANIAILFLNHMISQLKVYGMRRLKSIDNLQEVKFYFLLSVCIEKFIKFPSYQRVKRNLRQRSRNFVNDKKLQKKKRKKSLKSKKKRKRESIDRSRSAKSTMVLRKVQWSTGRLKNVIVAKSS